MKNRKLLLSLAVLPIVIGVVWFFFLKSPSQPIMVPVSGTVVDAQGNPLQMAKIEFVHYPFSDFLTDPPQSLPCAVSDNNGRFRLQNEEHNLVAARRYKVTVKYHLPEKRHLLPKNYSMPETTPIDLVIPKTGTSDLVLRVE
jgi:hypothetical protein